MTPYTSTEYSHDVQRRLDLQARADRITRRGWGVVIALSFIAWFAIGAYVGAVL